MKRRRRGALAGAPLRNGNGRADDADSTRARLTRGNALAWYRWFPGDHLRVTRGWPLAARGIYRELLDAQWDAGALPEDVETLRAIAGATPEEWHTGWPLVEPQFPVRRGRRRHLALEQLRVEATARLERHRAASQHAHAARWRRREEGDADA
jgi:uncharacterized protein YdaU (DUF1376 family)